MIQEIKENKEDQRIRNGKSEDRKKIRKLNGSETQKIKSREPKEKVIRGSQMK